MDKSERLKYLASIYKLVVADGDVAKDEEKAFEQITKDIGGEYFDRISAVNMAKKSEFEVWVPARYSDRVRIIEDMLYMAIADQKLRTPEKEILSAFAREIGVSKKLFSELQKEVKARFTQDKGL